MRRLCLALALVLLASCALPALASPGDLGTAFDPGANLVDLCRVADPVPVDSPDFRIPDLAGSGTVDVDIFAIMVDLAPGGDLAEQRRVGTSFRDSLMQKDQDFYDSMGDAQTERRYTRDPRYWLRE